NLQFLRSLSYSLVQDSSKLRRSGRSDHWLVQVHTVITRQLMHLDSTFGHPVPPKKWIFFKQVAWRLVFCPEKVDLSREAHQFVTSARGETDLLNVKDSQFERTVQCPEFHPPLECNDSTDEPAFHLFLETSFKPSQSERVRSMRKRGQKD